VNHAELDELAGRVQQGDHDAFTQLVHAVTPELRHFLSARAASVDVVEDVIHTTLLTAYQHIGLYERRGTFLAWVKGIGRNLLLKELHRRERYVTVEEDLLERLAHEAALPPENGNEEEEQELQARLKRCLQKLPEGGWQLIQLRYFQRQSVREMATALGRTESWVAVNLFRIRQGLRECMQRRDTP